MKIEIRKIHLNVLQADRVHKVQSEEQFRRRFAHDRRVFTFSHKQDANQPLMLLNIALTGEIADSIHEIVDGEEFRGAKKSWAL